jgi:hypothetical protein
MRIKAVYLTIESIGRGHRRPSRIILWLDEKPCFENPPASLRRLVRRGLEIKFCENWGPHKKYYPYVQSEDSFSEPLVTADDDVYYPCDWLSGLIESFTSRPHAVHCYRAYTIRVSASGIAPYLTWKMCKTTKPSLCHFATGVSGILYPNSFLKNLKQANSNFLTCCPRADDIWLHVQALRANFPVCQVHPKAIHFLLIPKTQKTALTKVNTLAGENDRQIGATYSCDDVRLLLDESLNLKK